MQVSSLWPARCGFAKDFHKFWPNVKSSRVKATGLTQVIETDETVGGSRIYMWLIDQYTPIPLVSRTVAQSTYLLDTYIGCFHLGDLSNVSFSSWQWVWCIEGLSIVSVHVFRSGLSIRPDVFTHGRWKARHVWAVWGGQPKRLSLSGILSR